MNKAELVAEIAKNTGLTKVDSERATEALLNTVAATLKKGDEVRLVGFGTFSVAKRAAKVAIRAPVPRSRFRLPNSRSSKPVKV